MSKQKLIYIVSEIDKSLHFEWISKPLKQSYNLKFILIGDPDSELEKFLKAQEIQVYAIDYETKRDFFRAWLKVFLILYSETPNIIHTHLWIANLIGLSAGWLLRISRRIYTRHHAMVHYNEYPSGLKWDKLCNLMATHIIAISENICNILIDRDKARPSKVNLIPHGFDFSYFENVSNERVRNLCIKYRIDFSNKPVVGVISRYTAWKGIQFIIPAFKKLLLKFPKAHLILSNAHGDYEDKIKEMLKTVPLENYTEIRFEYDLAALYRLFDVFIHVPTDPYSEAFGQTYIEPLIIGVPSIFTKSGIARQLIEHMKNAIVVEFQNSEQIYNGALTILENQLLRDSIIEQGKKSVSEFTIEHYLARLDRLYSQ